MMKILVPVLCAIATAPLCFLLFLVTTESQDMGSLLIRSVLIALFAAVYAFLRMRSEERPGKAVESPKPVKPESPVRPEAPPASSPAPAPRKPLSEAEKAENAARLEAMFAAKLQSYQSFGQRREGLVYQPVTGEPPADLPVGSLCEDQELGLRRHAWGGEQFSFSLDGKLLPIAVYQRERVTISSTRETESSVGYCWQAKVPDLEKLLRAGPAKFEKSTDGKLVARLFEDVVVHSTGLTTYLFLILDTAAASLEIQYYHSFDGE